MFALDAPCPLINNIAINSVPIKKMSQWACARELAEAAREAKDRD
jgi:hypothetical protein